MPLRRTEADRVQTAQSVERPTPENLADILHDPRPDVRRQAARELATDPHAAPTLGFWLASEDDPIVRGAILTSLAQLADPLAVTMLANCLRSEDATLRNDAIEAMRTLPEQSVRPVLQALLIDDEPDVRIFAVNVLAERPDQDLEAVLLAALEHEQHVNVCAALLDALAEVGTPTAHETLAVLARRFANEPYIHFACTVVIDRIKGA